MGTRFEKARFHVEYGPASLFERVLFKMKNVASVSMSGKHFKDMVKQRQVPEEVLVKIEKFNIKDWKLKTVEVRVDKGKFVNSTWEICFNEERYWLTIGFGNVAETIVNKNSSGCSNIVKNGDLFTLVDEVNSKLTQLSHFKSLATAEYI